MHRVDAVGNSLGVCRELVEGIESLPGWRKGVRQKKTETHRKIVGASQKAYRETNLIGAIKLQPDDRLRSSLSIGPEFERCSGISLEFASGISLEFARRFTEGIGKLARNMSGDCRKKTRGLTARMPEAVELAGVNRSYPSVRVAEPPRSAGKPPIPGFSKYDFLLRKSKATWGL
ncbi:hypothetical protein BHE74_00020379 [Ensete ventricosum]|nr:hypothetical protein BHE74_00020379 [Ensete ventricosum]RZR87294.1 hypothetical protein BHM03_00014663 [Ensete ventricosum]